MPMMLYTHDASWDPIRNIAAASIATNYTKTGVAVGSDAAQADDTLVVVATAHGVTAKDLVMFKDGARENQQRHAETVSADLITLGDALSGAYSSGDNFIYVTPDAIDAAEGGTTATTVAATGHGVSVGDFVWFVDGGETAEIRDVAVANANDFQFSAALSGAPSALEEFGYVTPDNTGAVEAGTTDTIITDADHAAVVNDLFMMTSGGEINEPRVVISTTTTTFTLSAALSGTPSATETYGLVTPNGLDTAEAPPSSSRVCAAAHLAVAGDEVIFTSGSLDGEGQQVSAVSTDIIDVDTAFSGAPANGDTFNIHRPSREPSHGGGKLLVLKSTLDQSVYVSFDGTNDHIILEGGDDMVLDMASVNLHLQRGDDGSTGNKGYMYVKAVSTQPTSGNLFISVAR